MVIEMAITALIISCMVGVILACKYSDKMDECLYASEDQTSYDW